MHDSNFVNLCQAVFNVTGYDMSALTKRNRSRKVLYPRQIVQFMLRSYYGYTFVRIGELFKQHHTSIMHSITSIETMVSINDPIITDLIAKINGELVKMGHFNGRLLLQMYVPIGTDLDSLKSLLIKKYNVSFNIF